MYCSAGLVVALTAAVMPCQKCNNHTGCDVSQGNVTEAQCRAGIFCHTCASGYRQHVELRNNSLTDSTDLVRYCKPFTCNTGTGSECKSCKAQADRTVDGHCDACNDDYTLDGYRCIPAVVAIQKCQRDAYLNAAGSCVECPAGRWSPDQNTWSTCLTDLKCGLGQLYNENGTHPRCETCPDGTYQDSPSHTNTECKPHGDACKPTLSDLYSIKSAEYHNCKQLFITLGQNPTHKELTPNQTQQVTACLGTYETYPVPSKINGRTCKQFVPCAKTSYYYLAQHQDDLSPQCVEDYSPPVTSTMTIFRNRGASYNWTATIDVKDDTDTTAQTVGIGVGAGVLVLSLVAVGNNQTVTSARRRQIAGQAAAAAAAARKRKASARATGLHPARVGVRRGLAF